MVCKKSIIAKILVILLVFFILGSSFESYASDSAGTYSTNVYYVTYNNMPYVFIKNDTTINYFTNPDFVFVDCLFGVEPAYCCFYLNNGSGRTIAYCPTDLNSKLNFYKMNPRGGYGYSGSVYCNGQSLSFDLLNLDLKNPVPDISALGVSVNDYVNGFISFINSGGADNIDRVYSVDWFNARPSIDYSLNDVKGSISDNTFIATWSLPDLMPVAEEYPVLIDFTITDLSNNEKAVYSYPATPDVYNAPRYTNFDVNDLKLSVDLGKIKDLPTDFRVDFATLTPYYKWVGEYIDLPVYYKGQSSSIYLGYTGHFEFVVQTPPDNPVIDVTDEKETEKGILISIQNFFSGFFNNFGTMLKNLFIPTKEQMQSLFADMESFFSDKLGFLWFPFDLAITIVETFTYGDADSIITVPPISLDILGGIDLYGGGQFDMDAVGIFPYVRMVSSLVLACSVAGLAYNKWDEWIGGHDK